MSRVFYVVSFLRSWLKYPNIDTFSDCHAKIKTLRNHFFCFCNRPLTYDQMMNLFKTVTLGM
jgi:hypothetical protein